MPRRAAASVSSNRSSSSATRCPPSDRPRWWRSAISSRFSAPVSRPSTAANWPVTPMRPRTSSASRTTSYPPTDALPSSGRRSVLRMWTTVVLPAPFGPSSANTVPVGTSRSMPSRTTWSPNALRNPSAVMAGGPRGWSGMWCLIRGSGGEVSRAPSAGSPVARRIDDVAGRSGRPHLDLAVGRVPGLGLVQVVPHACRTACAGRATPPTPRASRSRGSPAAVSRTTVPALDVAGSARRRSRSWPRSTRRHGRGRCRRSPTSPGRRPRRIRPRCTRSSSSRSPTRRLADADLTRRGRCVCVTVDAIDGDVTERRSWPAGRRCGRAEGDPWRS